MAHVHVGTYIVPFFMDHVHNGIYIVPYLKAHIQQGTYLVLFLMYHIYHVAAFFYNQQQLLSKATHKESTISRQTF